MISRETSPRFECGDTGRCRLLSHPPGTPVVAWVRHMRAAGHGFQVSCATAAPGSRSGSSDDLVYCEPQVSSAPVRVIPSVLGCITSPKLPPELDLELVFQVDMTSPSPCTMRILTCSESPAPWHPAASPPLPRPLNSPLNRPLAEKTPFFLS